MIPKTIHYCWFGGGEMPEMIQKCIKSWHTHMPDWEYRLWNEETFDIQATPAYVQEAYTAHRYAFVSDYVRLWALEKEGGLYMDVDFEVYKPFDDLMKTHEAFAGYEGSKYHAVMMGVLASEPHGKWVTEMRSTYFTRHFILPNGTEDLTPNTSFFSDYMRARGLVTDGIEKDFMGLHIYPVDYFSPRQTSGEYIRTENTYCETRCLNSWAGSGSWKSKLLKLLPSKWKLKIIRLKRSLIDSK